MFVLDLLTITWCLHCSHQACEQSLLSINLQFEPLSSTNRVLYIHVQQTKISYERLKGYLILVEMKQLNLTNNFMGFKIDYNSLSYAAQINIINRHRTF